ncbi:hypothetical protein BJX99DRAFT_241027 [Aspergillus californicus]
MADTTSHDTVGASTLVAPYFSPPSPSPSEHPQADTPDGLPSPISSPGARSPSNSPPSAREVSLDRAARELDARLAQYTVDFSSFPGGQGPEDIIEEQPELDEEERLSAVGGPEDFTANLERYLLGEEDSDRENDDQDEEPEHPGQEFDSESRLSEPEDHNQERQADVHLRQPEVEHEGELGEYSEFGPPVDMSTPSHFLRRAPAPIRDVSHLEDIEEDPDHEPSMATPTARKIQSPIQNDEKREIDDLRQQISELMQSLRDRDQQLEKHRRRVLEEAAAEEENKHLRAELQRMEALVEKFQADHAQSSTPRRPSIARSDFSALQKQITEMQKDMQSRNSNSDIDAERLETIAILRQQLSLTQEQLRKRDATLDDTLARLKAVTEDKELQLREKSVDIDRLRNEIHDQRMNSQKLEADLMRSNREHRLLEDQMALLETKNRPLEEKNSTLEADLTRAQSQVSAQETALKAMAADLPADTPGGTYSEILELIKDLGEPETSRPMKPRDTGDHELDHIYEELARLRKESSEAASNNKSLEAQLSRAHDQAAESQLLMQSIEAENTRLTTSADKYKSTLDQAQSDLNRLRTEHSEALETIDRIRDTQSNQQQNQIQPPSPPPTPHATLEATHKAQIASLKTSHATAISSLRTAHADSTRKLRALISASETRESNLRSELEQYTSTPSQDHEEELTTLHAEIKRLHSVIKARDETASAMDLRIAKSVEKREREWERRVDLLLKERERMSKALLWSWGEKEVPKENVSDDKENVGEDGGKRRQGYRYKYAKRT